MTSFVVSLIALSNIALSSDGDMCIWNSSFSSYGYNGLYRNTEKLHNNKAYYVKYSSCAQDFYLAYFEYSIAGNTEYHWGISQALLDNYWGGRCKNNGSTPYDACGEPGHFRFHGGDDPNAFIIKDSCPDVNCSIINVTDSSLHPQCQGVFTHDEYLQFTKKSFPHDITWWFNIHESVWVCIGEDEVGYLRYKKKIDFTQGDCAESAYDTIHGFYEIYKWCISISNQISNGEWSPWYGSSGYPFWWDGNHFRLETIGYHYINQICVSHGDSIDAIQVNFTDGNQSLLGGGNGGHSHCYSTKAGQCFTNVSLISSYSTGIVKLQFTTSDGEFMNFGGGSGQLYRTHYGSNNCITKMEFYSNQYIERIRFYFVSFNITAMHKFTLEPSYTPSDNPTVSPTMNPTVVPLMSSKDPTVSHVSVVIVTGNITDVYANGTILDENDNIHESGERMKSNMMTGQTVSMIVIVTMIIGFVIGYCFYRKNKIKQQLRKLEPNKNELLIVTADTIDNQ